MDIESLGNTEMLIDSTDKNSKSTSDIQAWLISHMAELLEIASDEIDIAIPFDRYGLDSSAVVGMVGELEDWLETELDPTLLYDYPTIESLAKHLGSHRDRA